MTVNGVGMVTGEAANPDHPRYLETSGAVHAPGKAYSPMAAADVTLQIVSIVCGVPKYAAIGIRGTRVRVWPLEIRH